MFGSELVDGFCSSLPGRQVPGEGWADEWGIRVCDDKSHSQETVFIYLYTHVTSKGLGQAELGGLELRAHQT